MASYVFKFVIPHLVKASEILMIKSSLDIVGEMLIVGIPPTKSQ